MPFTERKRAIICYKQSDLCVFEVRLFYTDLDIVLEEEQNVNDSIVQEI